MDIERNVPAVGRPPMAKRGIFSLCTLLIVCCMFVSWDGGRTGQAIGQESNNIGLKEAVTVGETWGFWTILKMLVCFVMGMTTILLYDKVELAYLEYWSKKKYFGEKIA